MRPGERVPASRQPRPCVLAVNSSGLLLGSLGAESCIKSPGKRSNGTAISVRNGGKRTNSQKIGTEEMLERCNHPRPAPRPQDPSRFCWAWIEFSGWSAAPRLSRPVWYSFHAPTPTARTHSSVLGWRGHEAWEQFRAHVSARHSFTQKDQNDHARILTFMRSLQSIPAF